MSENKPGQSQDNSSKTTKGVAVPKSKWRKWLSKKWVFPATYIAAAAIILTLMWVFQEPGEPTDQSTISQTQDSAVDENTDTLAVNSNLETMRWPVKDRTEVVVNMPFYDQDASNEAKQAAMFNYNDMFIPSSGISLAREDNETFEVVAAMSGEVTRVENMPLMGNLVEITHENGQKTVYSSLTEVAVAKGAKVKQGDVIAKAGRNEIGQELGVHVQFEVYQGGQPVNPEKVILD